MLPSNFLILSLEVVYISLIFLIFYQVKKLFRRSTVAATTTVSSPKYTRLSHTGQTKRSDAKLGSMASDNTESQFLFAKLPEPEVSISSEIDFDVANMKREVACNKNISKSKVILTNYIDDLFVESNPPESVQEEMELDDEIITVDDQAEWVDYRARFSANDEADLIDHKAI